MTAQCRWTQKRQSAVAGKDDEHFPDEQQREHIAPEAAQPLPPVKLDTVWLLAALITTGSDVAGRGRTGTRTRRQVQRSGCRGRMLPPQTPYWRLLPPTGCWQFVKLTDSSPLWWFINAKCLRFFVCDVAKPHSDSDPTLNPQPRIRLRLKINGISLLHY